MDGHAMAMQSKGYAMAMQSAMSHGRHANGRAVAMTHSVAAHLSVLTMVIVISSTLSPLLLQPFAEQDKEAGYV